jgi:hypothetical protein
MIPNPNPICVNLSDSASCSLRYGSTPVFFFSRQCEDMKTEGKTKKKKAILLKNRIR